MMLVSIIVPSFNQGRYIRETLDSILSQDYRPIEALVIDGGSTDETLDVLRSYGDLPELRWWSEPDKGVVDAVNKGLARASGEIVAIQSSDDVYLPGAVSAIATEFMADPELALAYGDVEYIDQDSRVISRTHLPRFELAEYIGKVSYIPQPAAFFTHTAAREAGPWREDISYAADAEFYLRVVSKRKAKKVDRLVARYRYHDAQRDKAGARIMRDWETGVAPYLRDPRFRRHARSGIQLTRHHYTPERQWVRRTIALYRALLANPALLQHGTVRAHTEWLPGRYPIWRLLSRLKRALGFRPR